MEAVAKVMLLVGFIGVLLALAGNAYVVFGMHRVDSAFFSQLWWGRWFPLYLVMLSVALIGIVLRFAAK